MKRRFLCACAALAVAAFGLLLVPMEAEALSLRSTVSREVALPGDQVAVTVSLSAPAAFKSGGVSVNYPADMLEPVSGAWLPEGAITDYDLSNAKGVIVFEEVQQLSGDLLELVFTVKAEPAEGAATVTCTPQLVDAAGAAVACDAAVSQFKVLATPGRLDNISSVYQYVSGGKDNSSLNGLAADNSAIYMYNGTLRTAFRIPATYQTDSADFSTVVLEGRSYPILERGIILGTPGSELTVNSPLKVSVKSGFGSKYWAYDKETGTVTYTALVKNVTREMKETRYVARAYMRVQADGKEYVVYSDVSAAFSPQMLYDATEEIFVSQGLEAPTWFLDSSIDDGIVDIT